VGTAGEAKLDLYREKKDVYVVTAAEMFDVAEEDVDKDFRQSGKIAELSLQFGGGASALIGMAKNFGIIFDDDTAKDIVRNWRRSNPWAEEIWADYQTAIDNAVRGPGEEFAVGRVVYFSDDDFLWCRLPSERILAYPRPLWETYFTPWDEERVGPTFQTHFKPAAGDPPLRNHARGALLFQNTVQAVAADLLRESLLLADDEGLNIVGHTHDEIIGIGSDTDGAILNKIMLETPWWAEGLPIATGGVSVGTRYGK
jgi:DNA polymerase